jgi:hypothetical protein
MERYCGRVKNVEKIIPTKKTQTIKPNIIRSAVFINNFNDYMFIILLL